MQVMLVEACRRQDVTGWWMSEKVNGVYTVRGVFRLNPKSTMEDCYV